MDGEIKDTLKKLNIKKDIYSGDLDKIKNIIVSKIKEKYNENIGFFYTVNFNQFFCGWV